MLQLKLRNDVIRGTDRLESGAVRVCIYYNNKRQQRGLRDKQTHDTLLPWVGLWKVPFNQ